MVIANLGIVAQVDADKTSLTARILFDTGYIPSVGSAADDTAQTDTMALAHARGITMQSAVVPFPRNTRKVNLIDTPGQTDVVAAEARRLVRAIGAAGLPQVAFVNTVSRPGARGETRRCPCTLCRH